MHVIKCHRTVYTHYTNVNFLVLILCYSYVRCNQGGNWVKGMWNLSVLSL